VHGTRREPEVEGGGEAEGVENERESERERERRTWQSVPTRAACTARGGSGGEAEGVENERERERERERETDLAVSAHTCSVHGTRREPGEAEGVENAAAVAPSALVRHKPLPV
jgi:hypothetical protein